MAKSNNVSLSDSTRISWTDYRSKLAPALAKVFSTNKSDPAKQRDEADRIASEIIGEDITEGRDSKWPAYQWYKQTLRKQLFSAYLKKLNGDKEKAVAALNKAYPEPAEMGRGRRGDDSDLDDLVVIPE